MMGACTSDVQNEREIWMLLEFCANGDLKNFLVEKREQFKASFEQNEPFNVDNLNSRLLLRWAFDIVKGMEYLSLKRIMHGDLATRNILLGSGGGEDNDQHLAAKISDFGLSKSMYRRRYYRKTERNEVPWRWMAYEYLENDKFKMKSDVWSYGVVIWEIFSLGKTPYGSQSYDEVYTSLAQGYSLPCPEEAMKISDWPAEEIYAELSSKCFKIEEEERPSFSDLVKIIESMLNEEEIRNYELSKEHYLEKSKLLLDYETRKRLHATSMIHKPLRSLSTEEHAFY
jgi:serine/threonine protein kinase